jgi:hypothetical protein
MVVAVLTPKLGTFKYSLSVSVRGGLMLVPRPGMVMHMPPLRETVDCAEILNLHEPCLVDHKKLIPTAELSKYVTDVGLMPVIMNALMRRSQDEQRLYQDYIGAGIDPAEARTIASEEAEFINI